MAYPNLSAKLKQTNERLYKTETGLQLLTTISTKEDANQDNSHKFTAEAQATYNGLG